MIRFLSRAVLTALLGATAIASAHAQSPADAARGKALIGKYCADCHGTENAPGFAEIMQRPQFQDDETLTNVLTDKTHVEIDWIKIRMPAVTLLDPEIRDVVAYLKTLRR